MTISFYEFTWIALNRQRHKTKLNIDQLLMPILESYQQFIATENRAFKVHIPQNIQPFVQDQNALERIITNFIDNALKFSNAHTTITIDVYEKNQGMLAISVKDEGIGIKETHLNYIFNRTYRVENSRNQATGGSGLGLYIAANLAEQIGGSISMDSVFKKGTTMTLSFPLN